MLQWGRGSLTVTLKTDSIHTIPITFNAFRNALYSLICTPEQSGAACSFRGNIRSKSTAGATLAFGNAASSTRTLTGYNWFAIGVYT